MVAATVAGDPICVAEVTDAVLDIVGERSFSEPQRQRIEAEILEQIIRRRLVLHFLRRTKQVVAPSEVEKRVRQLELRVQGPDPIRGDGASGQSASSPTVRQNLMWQLSWQRYIRTYLTEQRLRGYFDAHLKELDGSEVRVSHLLMRGRTDRDEEQVALLVQQAERIRESIVQGRISFAEAVQEYSEGPSRNGGGDLGFFPRHGRMVETFAKASFALQRGELSNPVVTPFGVHIIRLDDVQPGTKAFKDVVDEVRRIAGSERFHELARSERERVEVRYAGAAASIDPKRVRP